MAVDHKISLSKSGRFTPGWECLRSNLKLFIPTVMPPLEITIGTLTKLPAGLLPPPPPLPPPLPQLLKKKSVGKRTRIAISPVFCRAIFDVFMPKLSEV